MPWDPKKSRRDPGLKPKHAKFVAGYLQHGDIARAAKDAGYKPAYAHVMLKCCEPVKAAIAQQRKELELKTQYKLETAMDEAGRAYEVAEETKNSMAMVKAAELRSKLNGLLVEKHDIRQVGFVINANLRKKPPASVEAEEEEEDPFS